MNEKPVAQAMFHFIVISMPFTLFSAFFTIIVYCILVFNFFFFFAPFLYIFSFGRHYFCSSNANID